MNNKLCDMLMAVVLSVSIMCVPMEKPDLNYITLSFVGDCMLASMKGEISYNTFNNLANVEPPEYFFAEVSNIFKADDFTIANCENVFTDNALLEIEKGYEPAYWYKSKSANAEIFKKGGIDIVSLSNNHMMDYGLQGRLDTIAALEAADVEWGETGKPLYMEKHGVKIALYCTTISTGGYTEHILSWLDEEKEADYRIVYFHGGQERVYEPSEAIKNACRRLADNGANLIVGHHPHVLQPVEDYNGTTIVYSLGNFLFGGGRGENATAIFQHIIYISDGNIVHTEDEYIPCYVYVNSWQPTVITDMEDKQRILDFLFGKTDRPV